MEPLSKNQIIKHTHTTFYVWTPTIDALIVTKKALKKALKNRTYGCDLVESGTISYGKKKGKAWMTCVIMI